MGRTWTQCQTQALLLSGLPASWLTWILSNYWWVSLLLSSIFWWMRICLKSKYSGDKQRGHPAPELQRRHLLDQQRAERRAVRVPLEARRQRQRAGHPVQDCPSLCHSGWKIALDHWVILTFSSLPGAQVWDYQAASLIWCQPLVRVPLQGWRPPDCLPEGTQEFSKPS